MKQTTANRKKSVVKVTYTAPQAPAGFDLKPSITIRSENEQLASKNATLELELLKSQTRIAEAQSLIKDLCVEVTKCLPGTDIDQLQESPHFIDTVKALSVQCKQLVFESTKVKNENRKLEDSILSGAKTWNQRLEDQRDDIQSVFQAKEKALIEAKVCCINDFQFHPQSKIDFDCLSFYCGISLGFTKHQIQFLKSQIEMLKSSVCESSAKNQSLQYELALLTKTLRERETKLVTSSRLEEQVR